MSSADSASKGSTWFGHPRGLATLFFTEMWERFSFYGTRANLIFFMTSALTAGGLGFSTEKASSVFGLSAAAVYLLALPGGFVADRLIGQRKAVLWGGILIAAGNFSLAADGEFSFFAGLVLIALGTGLLKPNVSTMVGDLYPEGGARRDAGFSIFYSGINTGAMLAPLVCGYIGARISWRLSFAVAGATMVLGVVQYVLTGRHLGDAGLLPAGTATGAVRRRLWAMVLGALGLVGVAGYLLGSGAVTVPATQLANAGGVVILMAALGYFGYAIFFAGLDAAEKKRMLVIFVLFIFSSIFWAGFEQGGSSLNLFAEQYTSRFLFGWEMPAPWLQAVNSIMVVLLAPVFATLWLALDRRKREPSAPWKFVMGPLFMGLGFAVMMVASQRVVGGGKVGMGWLCSTYLLHTVGELCLSPVGLSTTTKLAPHRMVGQMMGLWFMSISLGDLIAGRVAGLYGSIALPTLFGWVAAGGIGAAVVLALIARPVTKMMGGVS
jgi:proton-dependent oligopeptide transporter, POT family